MEVAVACVKDVGNAQARFLAEALDLAHDLREGGARNHAVLNDVVGRDAAHGSESGIAAFPDEGALRVGLSYADFPGAVRTANPVDVVHQGLHFGDGAVELHQKQAAAIWIVGVDGGFGGLNGETVHHLDGGREHSRGDDAADGGAGFVGGIKRGEQRAHTLRALYDAQHHFISNSTRPFATNQNSGEVVAWGIESFSAEVEERAVGQTNLEAEDMRRRETVFKAVRAAGIFRDVAADGAHRL